MSTKEIGRLLTAMVTPFKADGSVDYDAAGNLALMLVADGSDGVVVSGTTGESPTLSDAEKIELVRVVKDAIPGKTVVAGTGSNDTHHSVELSKLAMKAGADALLAVVPYYNKPPQEGMYQHFKAISEIGPTIMYNIQGRTAINMTAATT
ncbi:MAG TPA: dihydrodipicolinate synthase family protein, partial [Candidatus Dormibacteraeota bacterium]|nr:dihydrodipicolinate synthase family protein [Candidatus Dormibacteraeota bacterium]